jgi:tetratricopeptide (TPR) repeat protein
MSLGRRSGFSRKRKQKLPSWPSRAIIIFGLLALALPVVLAYAFLLPKKGPEPQAVAAKLMTQSTALYEEGKLDKAAVKLRDYVQLKPNDWRARERLVEIDWQLGDAEAAFIELKKVSDAAPLDADRFYRLGLLAGQVDKPAESADYLARAVELNPESVLFAAESAKALARLQRYDEAISRWNEALALVSRTDPYAATIFAEIGDVLIEKGEIDPAKETYRLGLEIEPGNLYLQAQLGKVEQ